MMICFYFTSRTTFRLLPWIGVCGAVLYFIFRVRTLRQQKESPSWTGLSLTFLLYFKGGLVGAEGEGEWVLPSITRSSRQNRLGTLLSSAFLLTFFCIFNTFFRKFIFETSKQLDLSSCKCLVFKGVYTLRLLLELATGQIVTIMMLTKNEL